MTKHRVLLGIFVSLMVISNVADAIPLPFNHESVTSLKNSLGRLGSFAKQIADERVNLAMDRSLDTDSVEYLEKELKHLNAIDYILGARDRMMDIMHPDGEGIIKFKAGTNH